MDQQVNADRGAQSRDQRCDRRDADRPGDPTGDSKTDALNRAIQVYAYLEEVESNGGDIYVRETKDSEPRLLKMF